jgi:tetratricopeptide (TPR) repeat protein
MKKLLLTVVAFFATSALWAQEVNVVEVYNKGAEAFGAKNYAEAATLFQQVIEQGQDAEDSSVQGCVETAKKYLPTCYQGLGTRAAGQAMKATDANEANAKYEEAIDNLTKAAETSELYGNTESMKKANMILAKVYQAQGGTAFNNKDYATAAEIFAKGYAADPKNTKMAIWLGTSYCEQGLYTEGMDVLKKVAAMKGPRFEADAAEAAGLVTLYTNNQVAKLQSAGDYDGVIALADTLEQDAPNALAKKSRVQAYFSKKDYAKVIELGEAAAEAQSEEADKSDLYFTLGATYNIKEMKPQAIAALKKVTAGNNVAAAQKSIAELSK